MGYLAAAFLAGLLGSVHCVGMCGVFAASCSRVRGGLAAWHLGRITTYGLLGGVAGFAGSALPAPAWLPATLATLLLVWFALALAGLVPEPRIVPPGLSRAAASALTRPGVGAQLVFGVANGFLPCGLVYSALSIPVALAAPVSGAFAMLAFGAGTLPALSLSAMGLRRLLLATLWRRRLFATLVLITGLWTIWARASQSLHGGMHQHMEMPATREATEPAEH